MKLVNILLKKQYFERDDLGLKKEGHITQELNTTINKAKDINNLKVIFEINGIINDEDKRKLFNAEFEYRVDYELENDEEIIKEDNLRKPIKELYEIKVIPKLRECFIESGLSSIDVIEF